MASGWTGLSGHSVLLHAVLDLVSDLEVVTGRTMRASTVLETGKKAETVIPSCVRVSRIL